jgi:hypothetical protein
MKGNHFYPKPKLICPQAKPNLPLKTESMESNCRISRAEGKASSFFSHQEKEQ